MFSRVFLQLVATACLFVGVSSSVWAETAINDELLMAKKPAKKLADYGLFLDEAARQPMTRVISYELNNPLFTDYSLKYRFIYIPRNAGGAPYDETDVLAFPVGSVLGKTFAYPNDFRSPDKDIRFIETRLLIHKQSGWKAYPYVWNDAQTEAKLKVAGKRKSIPVIWKDGTQSSIDYAVPNMNQCKGCHVTSNKKLAPIGPKIRNLNRDHSSGDAVLQNQVSYLRDIGFIQGGPKQPSKMPRVPEPLNVESGSLFERARSYLDGNCAHCHASGRPADTSGLYLNYEEKREVHWGVNKHPVAAGRGAGGLRVDIKPGQPEKSILFYRMKSTDPGIMMPELGRSTVHLEGVDLIGKFITELK